jgi:hypothetical protein
MSAASGACTSAGTARHHRVVARLPDGLARDAARIGAIRRRQPRRVPIPVSWQSES